MEISPIRALALQVLSREQVQPEDQSVESASHLVDLQTASVVIVPLLNEPTGLLIEDLTDLAHYYLPRAVGLERKKLERVYALIEAELARRETDPEEVTKDAVRCNAAWRRWV